MFSRRNVLFSGYPDNGNTVHFILSLSICVCVIRLSVNGIAHEAVDGFGR